MSSRAWIMLNVPPEQVAQTVVLFCQRLFSHTTPEQIRVERFVGQSMLAPRITKFTELKALAEAVQPADERLDVRSFITTPTRKRVLVEVRCTGKESASFRELGALSIAFDTRDLIENDPFLGQRFPMARVGRCISLQTTTLTDIEAVFLRCIGWCPPRGSHLSLRWAALDLHRVWSSPDGYTMVYHPTLRGFAYDLTLSYIHHHWGLHIPPMFDMDDDLLDRFAGESWETLSLGGFPPPLYHWQEQRAWFANSNLADVDYTNRVDRALEHLAFLDDLSPTVVRKAEAMDEATIDHALTTALTSLPHIRRYSLAERGLVLAVDPPFTLWPVYAYLAKVATALSDGS